MLLALVLIYLVVLVFYIAVMWKVFTKAGRPGWAAIIPIYNAYILCKIAGRSSWWVLLLVIPIVNIVIGVILSLDIAKAFGKGGAFGFFGLFLFALIGYPILAFGDAAAASSWSSAPVPRDGVVSQAVGVQGADAAEQGVHDERREGVGVLLVPALRGLVDEGVVDAAGPSYVDVGAQDARLLGPAKQPFARVQYVGVDASTAAAIWMADCGPVPMQTLPSAPAPRWWSIHRHTCFRVNHCIGNSPQQMRATRS